MTRLNKARKDLKGMDITDLLDSVEVQQCTEDNDFNGQLSDWWYVVNHEGIIAYFGTEEEACSYRLSFINRILNG